MEAIKEQINSIEKKIEPKRKNKRLKNFNYTERHDNVVKNVKAVIEGKKIYASKKELLMDSGYTESSAMTYAAPNNDKSRSLQQIINDIDPVEQRIERIKRKGEAAESAEQYAASLKAEEILNKMAGTYAPVETNVNTNISVDHKVTHEIGDFKEFLEKKREEKIKEIVQEDKIIDGEIVEY